MTFPDADRTRNDLEAWLVHEEHRMDAAVKASRALAARAAAQLRDYAMRLEVQSQEFEAVGHVAAEAKFLKLVVAGIERDATHVERQYNRHRHVIKSLELILDRKESEQG